MRRCFFSARSSLKLLVPISSTHSCVYLLCWFLRVIREIHLTQLEASHTASVRERACTLQARAHAQIYTCTAQQMPRSCRKAPSTQCASAPCPQPTLVDSSSAYLKRGSAPCSCPQSAVRVNQLEGRSLCQCLVGSSATKLLKPIQNQAFTSCSQAPPLLERSRIFTKLFFSSTLLSSISVMPNLPM